MKLEHEIKQKKFKTEEQRLMVNIIFTSNWLHSFYETFFKDSGITVQQYNVLRILRGQFPNAASVKLIKERMLDKMSDASRIVDKLLLKKLVIRKQCQNDRRSVDVLITEKGQDLLKTLDAIDDKSKVFLKALTKKEIRELNLLLDKMRG